MADTDIHVRLPDKLAKELYRLKEAEGRTLNKEIIWLLWRGIECEDALLNALLAARGVKP